MLDTKDVVSVTRVVDGSPDEVFDAWTNPEILERWWWPAKWQTKIKVDLRVGGQYSFRTSHIPEFSQALHVRGTYKEVDRPNRLVYTWQWEGGPETEVTVEFIPQRDQTEVRLTHEGLESADDREQHRHGWNDCIDRLARLMTTGETSNA